MGKEVQELTFDDNSMLNKLEILFIFDKMGIPLTEDTVLDLCVTKNNWISYMETIECINDLNESGFLYKNPKPTKDNYYTLTSQGHECLNSFFARIPLSRRNEISRYIKKNRMEFKRAQEYSHSYSQNEDGTYTVLLKISDITHDLFELKLNVANRKVAKSVVAKWNESAPEVYSIIFERLID